MRDYGIVVDSVSIKHDTGHAQLGTQKIQINPEVGIDLLDLGTVMGFCIYPVEDGD